MKLSRARHDETGAVMVWFVVCAPMIFLMLAFAIDIGSWYLRASELQRASDAAALAGAAEMPDEATAVAVAEGILIRNGFAVGPDLEVSAAGTGVDDQLKVEITDKRVPSIFARTVLDQVEIKRSAIAEHTRPLELGSPENRLGTGPMSLKSGDTPQNFFLAVNGWCAPKEQGDPILSRFQGNYEQVQAGSVGPPEVKTIRKYHCVNGAGHTELNQDYSNVDSRLRGYNYVVRMPRNLNPSNRVHLELYDPGFNPADRCSSPTPVATTPHVCSSSALPAAVTRSDQDYGNPYYHIVNPTYPRQVGDPYTQVTTRFTLYWMKDPNKDGDDELLFNCDKTYSRGAAKDTWVELCTGPGKELTQRALDTTEGRPSEYRLQVQTLEGEANSYGSNTFGLLARRQGAARHQSLCNVEAAAGSSCPNVFGVERISTHVSFSNTSSSLKSVRFPLANIPQTYVGREVVIDIFDPDRRIHSMGISSPNNSNRKVDWSSKPLYPGAADQAYVSVDPPPYTSTWPQPGSGRRNSNKFNERHVFMDFDVPTNYADFSFATPGGLSTWWKLEYRVANTGGVAASDRSTWTARVSGSNPVHLVTE